MNANYIDILKAFFSTDNNKRKEAESQLQQLAKSDPNSSVDLHTQALDLEENHLSELAAVSIKKYHLQASDHFELVTPDRFELLAKKIIGLMENGSRSLGFYKRCSEILVLLYSNDNKTYFNLIQTVVGLNETKNDSIKVAILYFIELLCEHCFQEDHLKLFANDLVLLFEKFIVDTNIDVKVAAVKSIAAFLSSIDDDDFVKNFSQILPILLQTLIEAIKQDEDSGIATIQSISDLAEAHPTLIEPVIEDLMDIMSQVFKNKDFSDGLRNQAMNCVYTVCVASDVAVRKSNNFKNLVMPGLLEVICEIDRIDINEWLEDIEATTVSKTEVAYVAPDLIAKISDALKSKFMLTNYIPYIKQCLESNQWNAQFAGIMAMGVLAEGSSKFYRSEIDGIMAFILPGFESPDPRVVYATLTAVALFCNEYTPDIQKKYGNKILEQFLKIMNDDRYIKLQKQATSCIINFSEEIINEEKQSKILTKYADPLMEALIKLFQKALDKNLSILLEEVLNAISMISSVIDDEFAKYYDTFMPALKKLLDTIPNEDETQTRIRLTAIETMSFVMTSIRNEDRFINEADQYMEYFITLQNKLEPEDPEHGPILDFYCQLSSYMRENFVKYMPFIYPKVLSMLEIKVKFVTADNDEVSKKKFALSGKLDLKLFPIEHFTLDASAFSIKLAACNSVFSLSRNLGKAFYEYIPATLPIICKYFSEPMALMSEKAVKSIRNFVMACENEKDVVDIINMSFPGMLEAMKSRFDTQDNNKIHFFFKQMNKSLRYLTTPSLNQDLLANMVNYMAEAITLCDKLKQDVLKKFKKLKNYDEEKQEQMQEEYEKINDLMQIVMEISTKLMELYQEKIEGLLGNGIAPYFYKVIQNKDATPNEILYTVCFFDTFLEHCSMNFFLKAADEIIKYFINFCHEALNLDIVQSAVFGIGVIAKRMDQHSFSQYKNECLQIIASIITAPDAYSEEKAVCTDNAVGALGKIALYQSQTNDKVSEEVLLKFLQLLPLKNDSEEAQAVHKMLLTEIINKNAFLASCSQEVQGVLINAITNIKTQDINNPELEILDDQGKQLINSILEAK